MTFEARLPTRLRVSVGCWSEREHRVTRERSPLLARPIINVAR